MSENRCYKDCKIVNELKTLCLEKEKEIAKLNNKIYSLEEIIENLKKNEDKDIVVEEKSKEDKKPKKPPKVIGI